MFSHPELGLDPPIGSDRESGCDTIGDAIVICSIIWNIIMCIGHWR